jgi:hypothetical protein
VQKPVTQSYSNGTGEYLFCILDGEPVYMPLGTRAVVVKAALPEQALPPRTGKGRRHEQRSSLCNGSRL